MKRWFEKLLRAVAVAGCLAAAVVGVTGCGSPAPPPGAVTISLEWSGDADLDLELWSASDRGETLVAPSYDLPYGRDSVSGDRQEVIHFVPPDSGAYLVGVAFFAPGPSGIEKVEATVTAKLPSGLSETMSFMLDDESRDLWFPFRIEPGPVLLREDRYLFRGL